MMLELRLLGKLHCFSGKDIEAHRTKLSPIKRQTTHWCSFTCQIKIRSDSARGHMAGHQDQNLEKELFLSENVSER